ncbi:MAG: hypothetical protein QM756_34460 [Polyangiaceae bacterium]
MTARALQLPVALVGVQTPALQMRAAEVTVTELITHMLTLQVLAQVVEADAVVGSARQLQQSATSVQSVALAQVPTPPLAPPLADAPPLLAPPAVLPPLALLLPSAVNRSPVALTQ